MKQVFELTFVGWLLAQSSVCAQEFSSKELDFFELKVRPILVEHCFECHAADESEGGLRLDSRLDIMRGGDRGPAIEPGRPTRSLMMRAVSYADPELTMPPQGKLPKESVAVLREWIHRNAPWPKVVPQELSTKALAEPADHWAFQPVQKPALPIVRHEELVRDEIDRFVLARLEQMGLTPSPRADGHTLVRRATLDLTGLPSTYEQSHDAAMLQDRGFEQLVDRLLATPQYGERWGRHWLDVARYADTKGYVDGGERRYAFAYTYRDYVVRAWNQDLSFVQFIYDQLAGDLLHYDESDRWRLAGMGLLTVGRRFNHNYYDTIDDQIDVVSRGLQGLTVACARCHDHKYDPIATADYYSLYGIFANSYEPHHSDLPYISQRQSDSATHQRELERRAARYDHQLQAKRRQAEHELRAYSGDYLRYIVRENERHRNGPTNPLKTERTTLRGPTAYGFGAIRRWAPTS